MINTSNLHSEAVSIEHRLWNVFSCQRYGFGELVDADNISSNPYLCMVTGLAYNHKNSDNKEEIENFVKKYADYSKMSMREILEENQQDLENMINEFKELVG
ncbi:hypothetical protein ACRTAL_000265 [Clostridium perfringens]|uniref:hypothetical protein n=1 Tax=Clostridium perfringens TaxID=1502 RepID=UPI001A35BCA8|nr:hypothetical protein [Clostridium perfringens]MDU7574460.1 hypothetical protein [Clostridioides difficile]EHK2402857.1 hypothetical protein [Clostridium perfringens]MCS4570357.1 hypothetical protein [Clostridium perfringens]MDH2470749.1 hypothetical protein [Clostridium perfringens]MDK0795181.1 hypothetical protein [Clostridium perfringens]